MKMTRFRSLLGCALLLSAAACSDDPKKETDLDNSTEEDEDSGNDEAEALIDSGPPKVNRMDASMQRPDSGPARVDGGKPDASGALGEGGLHSIDGGSGGAFATCQQSLKTCGYDEKETACASITTPEIPLSAGGTWGKKVVAGGPYGAYVEWNQGMQFANPQSAADGDSLLCNEVFVKGAFNEPDSVNADVLNLRGADLKLFTIFRPACMKDGEKYPVITWGNGTCGQTGGYATLLANLASHGYVVIASNSRWTNQGRNEMLKALDLAKSLNDDKNGKYYQRLDLAKVGAMGHSQGAAATLAAASDPRVKSVIYWNGGRAMPSPKPFLTVSGDRDTNAVPLADLKSYTEAGTQPGAWLYFHQVLETGGSATGHLLLMMQPERVTDLTVAWWKWQLHGDQEAKKLFVGESCGLCGKDAEFEYGVNANLK